MLAHQKSSIDLFRSMIILKNRSKVRDDRPPPYPHNMQDILNMQNLQNMHTMQNMQKVQSIKYAEYAKFTKYAEYEVQSPISSFNLADLFSPRIWSSLFSSTFHIHFWSEFMIHRVGVISCCVIYKI